MTDIFDRFFICVIALQMWGAFARPGPVARRLALQPEFMVSFDDVHCLGQSLKITLSHST
ncbi:hypothetical protein ANAPC5_01513 [Anaplasma phagocytophilum]|nr:hypothetical protein ANAPC5_01513 [Anaplasma phagocytophilum]